MRTRFQVPDASCEHCKFTIESAMTTLDYVTSAELDLSTKVVTIDHASSVRDEQLTDAIRGAGYTPEPVR